MYKRQALKALDVNNPLLAVNLDDLALRTLRRAADNNDLVILADGERADLLLVCPQEAVR